MKANKKTVSNLQKFRTEQAKSKLSVAFERPNRTNKPRFVLKSTLARKKIVAPVELTPELVITRLVELVEEKSIRVSDIARAAGVHPTTALCYVKGECLPKTDKLPGLVKLMNQHSS
jgi:hypothetical protein